MSIRRSAPSRHAPLSPALLLGAGPGEATSGLLYLASYLRRHGVEAFVRLVDADASEDEVASSLASLMAHVRPRLVGLSLKWFHHLHRGLWMAEVLARIDPEVRIVLGGNTATRYWRELLASSAVHDVVLGDGEAALLALCRGVGEVPNHATRARDGTPRRSPLGYVQAAGSHDVYYSHFDELFLSRLDASSFSGWVAPGKGCAEACLYCGGGRATQEADFGRARPFLRPVEAVRMDHLEVLPRTWQLRFDFPGGTAEYLGEVWRGLDLRTHTGTYFFWGAPPPALVELLAATFTRVFLVLDIGCFAESQRRELTHRGLLKACPSDEGLLEAVARCRRQPNLQLEVCGIAGLPFTTPKALTEEMALVERLLSLGVSVGYQRLEAQPGALVTERAARFGMAAEAHDFAGFLEWFSQRPFAASGADVPMVRFSDGALERAVQRQVVRVEGLVSSAAPKDLVLRDDGPRLKAAVAARFDVALGAWLGHHRVPARLREEPVTVLRSPSGAGLSCAPSVDARRFVDPALEVGEDGAAVLAVLAAFERPSTLGTARRRLSTRLDPEGVGALVEALVAAHLLEPG